MSVSARSLRLLIALLLVNGLLLAPTWVGAGRMGPSWVALEACVLVGLFALLPWRRWSAALAGLAALAAILVSIVGLGDAAARQSLARPLNLYLDLQLVSAVHNLLSGALGSFRASLVLGGGGLVALALGLVLARLLSPPREERTALRLRLAGVALVLLSTVGLVGDRVPAITARATWPAVSLGVEQTRFLFEILEEREQFIVDLAEASDSHAERPGLLSRLRGRDVLLGFVESYGISAVRDPRFAPIVQPRLEELSRRMADAGLHLATGALVAPTQGGQSWFSHGSLASGLWLDNQMRYDLLVTSGRETLIDDFRHAGYRTVALMPAITMAWPEGELFRYDRIYAFKDIDYAGPPLNWVTMPDQFTWSFLEHSVRGAAQAPLFAEVGLISSHAPWTPILTVLDDWESVGNGSVFDRWEHSGERPEDLWLDTDRVREHYALAVDYAISAMTGYAENYVDEDVLLIVMGDHQPAPLIIGDDAGWDVPVHVISGDPVLVQPFLDWGFVPGGIPDAETAALGMDHFRDWFVDAFSARDDGRTTGTVEGHE